MNASNIIVVYAQDRAAASAAHDARLAQIQADYDARIATADEIAAREEREAEEEFLATLRAADLRRRGAS